MKETFLRVLFLALSTLAWTASPWTDRAPADEKRWYKGNLHTHTINSDGDSSPDEVARWYKERRYHFLALTDHNYFTDPQGLNEFLAARERFLLLTGEEVTSRFEEKPVHVNAFRLRETIEPRFGSSVLDTLQKNVDEIRRAGALPSLNHPNFHRAVSSDDLRKVDNLKLFEIFNGHPTTNDVGAGGRPGLDEMWDAALTAGRRLWGIAVDDAHVFKAFSPDASNPGRGWIHVRAGDLSEASILAAIEAGDFYASTGVELEEVERGAGSLRARVAERPHETYSIEFIGPRGRLLGRVDGPEASHRLGVGETYVRARVVDSNGRAAWTQPVFAE